MNSEVSRNQTAGAQTIPGPDARRRGGYVAMAVLLVVLVFLLYGRSLTQPFVQDDWAVLYHLKWSGVGETIVRALLPEGTPMYRPLGMIYFLAMYHIAGMNPSVFHLVGLVLHTINSLLAGLIILRITGRNVLSASVAVLYAAASTIHGDTLLWIVGFYDLAGIFFFFSSLLLYLRGRMVLSAGAFVLGLVTKEATAVLPLVLLAHALLLDRSRLRQHWLHALVLVIYVAMRLSGVNFLALEHSDPYRMELLGEHIISNIGLFSAWALEVAFPFWHPHARLAAGVAALFLAILAFVAVLRKPSVDRLKLRQSMFFVCWMILGVVPVLLLKHHLFRYYAVYSLAPFLTLVFLYASTILALSAGQWRYAALAVFIVVNVAVNWTTFNDKFRIEPGSVAMFDGTNHLIRKGAAVRAAQTQMLLRYPSLPPNAQLVISGLETEAFFGAVGPRIWYNDTSLEVYTAAEFDSVQALGRFREDQTYFMRFAQDTLLH
jgi:hypothetical protein